MDLYHYQRYRYRFAPYRDEYSSSSDDLFDRNYCNCEDCRRYYSFSSEYSIDDRINDMSINFRSIEEVEGIEEVEEVEEGEPIAVPVPEPSDNNMCNVCFEEDNIIIENYYCGCAFKICTECHRKLRACPQCYTRFPDLDSEEDNVPYVPIQEHNNIEREEIVEEENPRIVRKKRKIRERYQKKTNRFMNKIDELDDQIEELFDQRDRYKRKLRRPSVTEHQKILIAYKKKLNRTLNRIDRLEDKIDDLKTKKKKAIREKKRKLRGLDI